MPLAHLEHTNYTVTDPKATAAWMCDVFGWHIRWQGVALNGEGYTVHVGDDTGYLALYGPSTPPTDSGVSYAHRGGLNHIGLVVDDLDAAEARVKAAGFETHSHADYEPGRRFYFHDGEGIEYELVSYSA